MGYCDCPNKVGRLDYTDKRYLLIHSVALMMELFGQYREIHLLPNTIGLSPAGAVANIVNREEFTWSEVYYLHYYCAKIGVPKPWDVSTLFPAHCPKINKYTHSWLDTPTGWILNIPTKTMYGRYHLACGFKHAIDFGRRITRQFHILSLPTKGISSKEALDPIFSQRVYDEFRSKPLPFIVVVPLTIDIHSGGNTY